MNDTIWFPQTALRRPGWSFQSASAVFFSSRREFLQMNVSDVQPRGQWELTCFPLKDFIGVEITGGHISDLRNFVRSLTLDDGLPSRPYDARKKIEAIFMEKLAYPPYPLTTEQDRHEVERRAFAIRMFKEGHGFNPPPK